MAVAELERALVRALQTPEGREAVRRFRTLLYRRAPTAAERFGPKAEQQLQMALTERNVAISDLERQIAQNKEALKGTALGRAAMDVELGTSPATAGLDPSKASSWTKYLKQAREKAKANPADVAAQNDAYRAEQNFEAWKRGQGLGIAAQPTRMRFDLPEQVRRLLPPNTVAEMDRNIKRMKGYGIPELPHPGREPFNKAVKVAKTIYKAGGPFAQTPTREMSRIATTARSFPMESKDERTQEMKRRAVSIGEHLLRQVAEHGEKGLMIGAILANPEAGLLAALPAAAEAVEQSRGAGPPAPYGTRIGRAGQFKLRSPAEYRMELEQRRY